MSDGIVLRRIYTNRQSGGSGDSTWCFTDGGGRVLTDVLLTVDHVHSASCYRHYCPYASDTRTCFVPRMAQQLDGHHPALVPAIAASSRRTAERASGVEALRMWLKGTVEGHIAQSKTLASKDEKAVEWRVDRKVLGTGPRHHVPSVLVACQIAERALLPEIPFPSHHPYCIAHSHLSSFSTW